MRELTIELTNFCPHNCPYCSSNTVDNPLCATFIEPDTVIKYLEGEYDRIILSGGEPLAHPRFYEILEWCKAHTSDVVVCSNAITHLVYNQSVIDGVYLEANVTVLPEVDKVHILRRVKQGREANRPEVHLSRNFSEDCACEHRVVRPNGEVGLQPCNKWSYREGDSHGEE